MLFENVAHVNKNAVAYVVVTTPVVKIALTMSRAEFVPSVSYADKPSNSAIAIQMPVAAGLEKVTVTVDAPAFEAPTVLAYK